MKHIDRRSVIRKEDDVEGRDSDNRLKASDVASRLKRDEVIQISRRLAVVRKQNGYRIGQFKVVATCWR